jgi:phosphatidylinositol N-acetylglucosaminyltransferase subunit C
LAPVNAAVRAPPFPSSLSTNAALMASTVLASRLTSTTHVFSLTLFSIEVFGLFPVFRRHLRHESWTGHVLLTTVLVALSSGGMGLILSKSYTHTYGACGFCWGWIWHVVFRSLLGFTIGGLGTAFVMGGCSWWLIGLQRYKNVVTGPWDPARPILTGGTHRGRGGTD